MTLTVKGPGLAGLLKNVRALTRTDVLVGVTAQTAPRDDGPITNAAIGYLNETGQPERNLPARPHLVPGIESVSDKITERFKIAGQQALIGDMTSVSNQQHAAGLVAQTAVKRMIEQRLSPALSPVTLHRRKTRKKAPRTGDTPLIDEGGYLQSIVYVIRDRNA